MKRAAVVLLLALFGTVGCSQKLQNDSPRRESSKPNASPSDGYAQDNKTTPQAPARSYDQGTGMNTGGDHPSQPSTTSSTPGTDKNGQGQSNGHSNETVPPKH